MKFAYFKGCKIPYYLEQYGTSTAAVLKKFDIKLKELPFTCCGYPNRDINFKAYVLSSARNIALAEKNKLDIITPCQCCFGSLKHANHYLKENDELRNDINDILRKEGLEWKGTAEITHPLIVLAEDIGAAAIQTQVRYPLGGIKVAAHYGCHALRPSNITHFDNPLAPTIFEELIKATGAVAVDWPRRLECCGNPLWGKNDDISLELMKAKLMDAGDAEADCIATACTYCQIQFDTIQKDNFNTKRSAPLLPAVLFTQLLGVSFGFPERVVGLKKNALPCDLLINK